MIWRFCIILVSVLSLLAISHIVFADGVESEAGVATFDALKSHFSVNHFDWDSINADEQPYSKMMRQIEEVKKGANTGVGASISMTTNFKFPKTLGDMNSKDVQYYYSRFNNPNHEQLERQMAALYDAHDDDDELHTPNDLVTRMGSLSELLDGSPSLPPSVLSFSSGMGAISAVLWSLVQDGDRIIVGHELYYEIKEIGELMNQYSDIKMIQLDVSDIEAVVGAASDPAVKVLYMESASNPHGRIPDFDELIPKVRMVNPNIMIVIDNTWLSPTLFQPFLHDVDVIVESGSKYLSGKADALLGIAIVYRHPKPLKSYAEYAATGYDEAACNKPRVSQYRYELSEKLPSKLRVWRKLVGSNANPMASWLIAKGLETLPLRMEHVSLKIPELATFIQSLPPVTRVLYCGSPSHPHYHLAQKYFLNGYCAGVLSFHLPLDSQEQVEFVMRSSDPIIPAPSFGEAQTLVMWPRNGSSHNFPGDETRGVKKLNGYWFRFSVGLSPLADLKRHFFRWMARLPFFTQHLASVSHDSFKRCEKSGVLTLTTSKEDWARMRSAPSPLWLKRQELSDIDSNLAPLSHPIPIVVSSAEEVGANTMLLNLHTTHITQIANFVSHPAKYIISSFKNFDGE